MLARQTEAEVEVLVADKKNVSDTCVDMCVDTRLDACVDTWCRPVVAEMLY